MKRLEIKVFLFHTIMSILCSPKINAIDTTAAGDVFNGYFVAALKDNDLRTAVELGMKSATMSVTRKKVPNPPFHLKMKLNNMKKYWSFLY